MSNLRTDSTNTRRALTWIQAQKHSLKLTFSQRTSGPNCFFLSVTNLVISFLPEYINFIIQRVRSLSVNINNNICERKRTSRKLLLVVRKVTDDKLLFSCVELEFFNDFLKESDVEETVLGILSYKLRTAGYNHIGQLLVNRIPFLEVGPWICKKKNGKICLSIIILPICRNTVNPSKVEQFSAYFGTITSNVDK